MNDKQITILQLYPRDMNIYGDWGNTLVLKRRLEWHGYSVNLTEYNPGDTFPTDVDLIVGGFQIQHPTTMTCLDRQRSYR